MAGITIDMMTMIFVLCVFNLVAVVFLATYLRLTGGQSRLAFFGLTKLVQGLSWGLRLASYREAPGFFTLISDLTLIGGFAMESALFVSFGAGLAKKRRYLYAASIVLFWALIIATGGLGETAKNLAVLAGYLTYMGLAAAYLLLTASGTAFQRFLGFTYGTMPLLSVVFFVLMGTEVTRPGSATSGLGFAYYFIVILMQIVGSVGYLLMFKERTELKLEAIASRDSLTGILNRRAFFERAQIIVANAARARDSVSAVMMDLDHFKNINDNHGHQVGDRVIRHFCGRVAGAIRKGDILARYGGEEFVILLPRTDRTEAQAVAARIRRDLDAKPSGSEEALPAYGVSMGISTGIATKDEDLDLLLATSDEAMYWCKHNGRGRTAWLEMGGQGADAQPLETPE